MSAVKIIAIIFLAAVALAAVGVKLRDRHKLTVPGSVALPAEHRLPALAALSDGQKMAVEKMAEELCTAINEGRVADMKKHFDYDGLLDRVFAGFATADRTIEGVRNGARSALEKREGGILTDAVGGQARFVRLRDINGQAGALIRALTKDGAVMLAYLMPRCDERRARVVDAWMVATDSFTTEHMRDVMIPMLGKTVSGGPEGRALMDVLARLRKAQEREDMQEVMKACNSLPPEMRKRPAIRMVYLQALMASENDDAYLKELQRIQREDPESVGTSFKLLDLHILKKEWAEGAAAARRVDESVGGDAYMKAMAGMCLAWAGKHKESEELFAAAESMEPSLETIIEFRLHLDCARRDYPALVKNLDRMKQEFALELEPEELAENYPGFQGFLDSDEYKAWKAKQPP